MLLLVLIGIVASCSNKKDLIYPTQATVIINEQKLVDRFLQVPTNANEDVKKILANIAKTEEATPFLANYAAKFGVPAWQYMFSSNKQLANQQLQNGYTTFGTNTASNSNRSVYFIPLTDSVTKRTKAFIYCRQYNDTLFTYRTYDIDMALASQPTTDTLKQNKDVALSFAAYFERKINGSVQTEAFKNNKFSNVNIRETNNPNLATNNALNSVQVLATECSLWLHLVIEHHLGNGQIELNVFHSIRVPCGDDGIGGSNIFFPISIITNPPPPPNPDPSLGTGDGTTTNPPNYYSGGYQNGPYTPPNHWSIWNPNYDPSLFPFGSFNIQQLAVHPTALYTELDNQINDQIALNNFKNAYFQLELMYSLKPVDQYTNMSSAGFIEMLKTNPSLANSIDPVTILVKIGISAAADVLTQIFFTKLSDPTVNTWGEAFSKVDWWQVGATAATSIIPWNTTAGKFLVAAINGSVAVISDLSQNGFQTWERTGLKFVEGFCGSLAGSYMGDIILKFGSKANFGKALVTKLANKIPYSTICKWLGGGVQLISKSVTHSAAHGGEITATRIMKGWAADKIAVVGRNMQDRVNPFKNGLSSELGHPVLSWDGFNLNLSEAQNLANNKAWIQALKEEGYTFYDVGLDPEYTSVGNFAEGKFYAMELDEIFR